LKKSINEFHNWPSGKDGKFYQCKACCSKQNKLWRLKNKERLSEYNKTYQPNYYKNNKKKVDKKHAEYYSSNKEKLKPARKKYYENNKERLLQIQKNRLKDPRIRERRRKVAAKRERERLRTDPNFKLKKYLRTRIWNALKGNVKSRKTMELLGASIEIVKTHLQSKFTDGMTWENYGQWHVDHIVPCDAFDLSIGENQKICFHYTNLQPLWKLDNMKKSNKIIPSTRQFFLIRSQRGTNP
jgi:hypothetical protein